MDFLKASQEAYEASTAYVDANCRADWDYALRAFRNEHASGSKYLSEEYKHRSRLFRPKTRSIIRKNEAAAAMAMFSSMDVVTVQPVNPDDPISVASAGAMKAVLEHRLTKTIPAFQVCLGALQDAQTTGIVVSYQYWEYEKRGGRVIKDRPCIELRPIENIRLDGAASWLDPIGTTPYFCDIVPMYVCDVRAQMANEDGEVGQVFKKHEDSVILRARPDVMDATRKARYGQRQDPQDETTGIKDFDVVWVMRWFMKNSQGDDYTFYTLGTEELLTDPLPVQDVYFHGRRPYVMGYCVLETHKVLKTGLPILTRPLQQEANDVQNQRLDNVKFVLNKRWFVARGRQVDVNSLVRNAPGGVTLVTDPKTDVEESNWPDVTSSSYVEQDRINSDFDDLAGNFSPSTKVANNAVNDTLGGSRMASQSVGVMTDYLLRTFIETWWEPVLRQLVLLERYYETDQVVLSLCAQKARLFPRFSAFDLQQLLESNEVDVVVNVGMGASDPQARLQKFLFATQAILQAIATAPPGFNVQEFAKEVYSMAGYRDGARFISEQQDPRLIAAMKTLQELKKALESKQMELQSKERLELAKIASDERIDAEKIMTDRSRVSGDLDIRNKEVALKQVEVALKAIEIGQGAAELDNDRQGKLMDTFAKLEAIRQEPAKQLKNEFTQSVDSVSGEVDGLKSEIKVLKAELKSLQQMRGDVQKMTTALQAVAAINKKRKVKKISVKRDAGKPVGAIAVFDDDSTEEITVN